MATTDAPEVLCRGRCWTTFSSLANSCYGLYTVNSAQDILSKQHDATCISVQPRVTPPAGAAVAAAGRLPPPALC